MFLQFIPDLSRFQPILEGIEFPKIFNSIEPNEQFKCVIENSRISFVFELSFGLKNRYSVSFRLPTDETQERMWVTVSLNGKDKTQHYWPSHSETVKNIDRFIADVSVQLGVHPVVDANYNGDEFLTRYIQKYYNAEVSSVEPEIKIPVFRNLDTQRTPLNYTRRDRGLGHRVHQFKQ